MLPVIGKVGGSVDRVNGQLDKVDQITDSAVDAAQGVDTAVRTVSMAVTRPVERDSGLARRDWRHAMQTGKEAAVRRESDLADELRSAGT